LSSEIAEPEMCEYGVACLHSTAQPSGTVGKEKGLTKRRILMTDP
jgi:hypothetical protein